MHHCIWKSSIFPFCQTLKTQLHKRAEIGVEQVEGHFFRLKLDELQTLLMQRVHCRQCRPGHITCIYPSYICIIFFWAFILSEFGSCITWYRYNKWREIRVAYAACALQTRSAGRIICIFSKDVSSLRLCTCIGSFSHFAPVLAVFQTLHLHIFVGSNFSTLCTCNTGPV